MKLRELALLILFVITGLTTVAVFMLTMAWLDPWLESVLVPPFDGSPYRNSAVFTAEVFMVVGGAVAGGTWLVTAAAVIFATFKEQP